MVLALDEHGPIAGMASALGGTLQMVAGAAMIGVVSVFFDGTATADGDDHRALRGRRVHPGAAHPAAPRAGSGAMHALDLGSGRPGEEGRMLGGLQGE